MPASPVRTPKVPAVQMSTKDREFEDLLKRAADLLKQRPAPARNRAR
jgi:hypothetical protein